MNIKLISFFILTTITQICLAESAIKFDWGRDKAVVTETIHKNNNTIKAKYQVQLKKKQGGYVLRQTKVRLISLNGEEIPDLLVAKQLSGLFTMPSMKFDENGELIEVLDSEKFIEKYIDLIPDPNARKFYEKPQMQNLIFMKAYEKWCYWVCVWTNLGLTEEEPIEGTQEIEFMGSVLPQITTITHHGQSKEHPGLVKLINSTQVGIQQPVDFVDNVAKGLGVDINDKKDKEVLSSASKVTTVEAITEEKTLKPKKIVVDIKITASSDSESQSKNEQHLYEFEWR